MRVMSRSSLNLALAGISLLGLALALPAQAQTVYAAGSRGQFGTFDITTGSFTNIGTTTQVFFGIAFAPDGTLYGVDASSSSLYTINATTGATTLVGNTGINGAYGLAFRSDGKLFTMNLTSTLYTVDPTTGAATAVGPIGNSSAGTVEFDASDTLYETNTAPNPDTLNTLSQTTGAATLVGSTGFDTIYGLAAVNGSLYGFDSSNDVIQFNTANGAGTLLRQYTLPGGGFIEDATVLISQRAVVPEPGSVALLAGLAVTGAGFTARRRARK